MKPCYRGNDECPDDCCLHTNSENQKHSNEIDWNSVADGWSGISGKQNILERIKELECEHAALLRGQIPTHFCNICGALWTQWVPDPGEKYGNWSLFSLRCGPCCDNAPMVGQIQLLPRLS